MERKDFLKICGVSCLGFGISILAESCGGIHYVQSVVNNNQVRILRTDFLTTKKKHRKYIILKADRLNYPVVVYRYSETDYVALLMRCTHQSNELSVNGDILTCSAHGSEFSNKGEPIHGPAEERLKSFPITVDGDNIFIQLS